MVLTYQSYDRDVRKIFDDAGFEPDVKYYFKDDFAKKQAHWPAS